MKKVIIISLVLVLCIIGVVSLVLFNKKDNNERNIPLVKEVKWEMKYGKEFDNSNIKDYQGDLNKNISVDYSYNDLNYVSSIPFSENGNLIKMDRLGLDYQSNSLALNVKLISESKGYDFTQEIYNKYKDLCKDIVIYEKKKDGYIYIIERNIVDNLYQLYEERLIIAKGYSTDDRDGYFYVQYVLVNNKFNEEMINNIIKNYKINNNKNENNSYCTSSEGTMNCEFAFEGTKKINYSFYTMKYTIESLDRIGPFPIKFIKKNTDIAINIELDSLPLEVIKNNKLEWLNKNFDYELSDSTVTVNDKEFTVIRYESYDIKGLEYLYPLSPAVTLHITMDSESENMDDVINDFSNFTFVS